VDDLPRTLFAPDSGHFRDAMTDAAIPMLARDGCSGISLRTLADELRMSPQGVRRWFGSIHGTWEALTMTFGSRWVHWLGDVTQRALDRWPVSDTTEFVLPLNESEIAATRAWLALCEATRHDESLAELLDHWERLEEQTIARLLVAYPAELDEVQQVAAVALVRGLRHAMTSQTRPLPVPDALAALRRAMVGIAPDRLDMLHSRP
jgi:AcrR family transcriptional regulator